MMTGRIFTLCRSLAKNIDSPFPNLFCTQWTPARLAHRAIIAGYAKNVARFRATVQKENVNLESPPKSWHHRRLHDRDVPVTIADGFGFHFLKGYISAAKDFPGRAGGLDMLARRRRNQPPE